MILCEIKIYLQTNDEKELNKNYQSKQSFLNLKKKKEKMKEEKC